VAGFLGVDFGTTNTVCVSLDREGGYPVPIRLDGALHLKRSLCFSLDPAGPDAEWVFGRKAGDLGLLHGHGLVDDLKRGLPDPQAPKGFHPSWNRRRLLADFLKSILEQARAQGVEPERLVITAPERFDPLHRSLVLEAMKCAAGPDVQVELLSEPVAAAVCYAARREQDELVLVFDWGGGTLDVALVQCSAASGLVPGPMRVLASDGNAELGGADIDIEVAKFLRTQLEAHLGAGLEALDGVERSRLHRELARRSSNLKEQLSVMPRAESSLPLDWAARDALLRLERTDLEPLVAPFQSRALEAVNNCLKTAGVGAGQVGRVLLVGGSSALPGLAGALQERFGFGDILYRDEDPSTAIARGAVMHAAARGGSGLDVQTIASSELGVLVASGMFPAFETLVPAGASLPASCSRTFPLEPGQSQVCVPLAVRSVGSRKNRVIDTLQVTVPGAQARCREVGVHFQVDRQGTLDVQVLAQDHVLARKAFPLGDGRGATGDHDS